MREPSPQAIRIRQRREELRLSRAALAQKARLSLSTIKNAERGQHVQTRVTLAALAAALELPELVDPRAPTGPESLAVLLKQCSAQILAASLRLTRGACAALWSRCQRRGRGP